MSGIGTPLLTQSFELLSGSIGWGAGLQTSRLVQSKDSNPLKVLLQEYKVIYLMYRSAKFELVLTRGLSSFIDLLISFVGYSKICDSLFLIC